MCLTPMLASVADEFLRLVFTSGIIGSIRTETGIPALVRSCAARSRWEGEGANGSRILARLSSSVVIVNATVEGTLLGKSSSRVTRLLLVIIWILQLLSAKISRHRRVSPSVASALGYGSDEFDIEMVSPLSLAASRLSLGRASFFGSAVLEVGNVA